MEILQHRADDGPGESRQCSASPCPAPCATCRDNYPTRFLLAEAVQGCRPNHGVHVPAGDHDLLLRLRSADLRSDNVAQSLFMRLNLDEICLFIPLNKTLGHLVCSPDFARIVDRQCVAVGLAGIPSALHSAKSAATFGFGCTTGRPSPKSQSLSDSGQSQRGRPGSRVTGETETTAQPGVSYPWAEPTRSGPCLLNHVQEVRWL